MFNFAHFFLPLDSATRGGRLLAPPHLLPIGTPLTCGNISVYVCGVICYYFYLFRASADQQAFRLTTPRTRLFFTPVKRASTLYVIYLF